VGVARPSPALAARGLPVASDRPGAPAPVARDHSESVEVGREPPAIGVAIGCEPLVLRWVSGRGPLVPCGVAGRALSELPCVVCRAPRVDERGLPGGTAREPRPAVSAFEAAWRSASACLSVIRAEAADSAGAGLCGVAVDAADGSASPPPGVVSQLAESE